MSNWGQDGQKGQVLNNKYDRATLLIAYIQSNITFLTNNQSSITSRSYTASISASTSVTIEGSAGLEGPLDP
jgi:hypothetical protein